MLTSAALALALAATSVEVPPEDRVLLSSLLVLRSNPIGLEDQLRLGVQQRLYRSEADVSRDNFVFFGLYPKLNPAYSRLGTGVELQPLSILNLKAAAEYVRFFDAFGFVQSYGSAAEDWSDSARKAGEEAGRSYATSAGHVTLEPMLQLKVGPIAFRNRFSAELWVADLQGDDRTFYEASLDTLVPGNGWVLTNDADLLWLSGTGIVAGLRHSAVRPLYEGADEGLEEENGHHRLGVLGAYSFYDEGQGTFDKPTVLAIVSWYLDHKYRTGLDVANAVPYVVVGFAFRSDLIEPKR